MAGAISESGTALHTAIAHDGFAFAQGALVQDLLRPFGATSDWRKFADSWNRLELDTYMADGGRYRKRRHAVYATKPGGTIVRQPHQPHYQTVDYKPLNGGLDRWFEPVEPSIGSGRSM